MKTNLLFVRVAMVVATITLAASITGCTDSQESSPAGPSFAPVEHPAAKAAAAQQKNGVDFARTLRDPRYAFNSFIEVNGQIVYDLVSSGPVESVRPTSSASLNLYVEAELRFDSSEKPFGKVLGSSSAAVNLPMQQKLVTTVRYPVSPLKEELDLHITLVFSGNAIEIQSMWLTKAVRAQSIDVKD
jgi:hypothetical protein